jgi:hypothetical protein
VTPPAGESASESHLRRPENYACGDFHPNAHKTRVGDPGLSAPFDVAQGVPSIVEGRQRGDPTSSPRADPGASGVFFRLTLARPASRDSSANSPADGVNLARVVSAYGGRRNAEMANG